MTAPENSDDAVMLDVRNGTPALLFPRQFSILLRMQLVRFRTAWRRYIIISSAMPLGIIVLLRVRGPAPAAQAVQFVAGGIVLATALSALTFLAQRMAWMKANRIFDYYNTLPTSTVLLVLAVLVSFFVFALPGVLAITIIGCLIFGVPLVLSVDILWAAATLVVGGIALAGIGTLIGLLARDEHLAGTYANLAMMAVLFLAIVPSSDFPRLMRPALFLVPSSYMVDSFKLTLTGTVRPVELTLDLLGTACFAFLTMLWSTRVLRTR